MGRGWREAGCGGETESGEGNGRTPRGCARGVWPGGGGGGKKGLCGQGSVVYLHQEDQK